MPGPTAAIAGSAVVGALSSRSAAKTQASAADRASDMQYRMFQEQSELQRPYREAGENALGFLREGVQPGGRFMQDFGMDQFQADPGYGFRLSEGLKALERQAAARGGLISGAALKAAGRYGQESAANEYANAFNRFRLERGDQYNRLAGVAGTGQTAVNQLGQQSAQLGNQMGSNMIGAGNARASGYMGSANAIAGGVGQGTNMYMGNQLMNRAFPMQGGQSMQGLQGQYGYGNVYGPGGASTSGLGITNYDDM